MSLGRVIDRFAAFLPGAIAPAVASVGGALPTSATGLPAIVLSIPEATEVSAGVGHVARPTRRGALSVTSTVRLDDPRLVFPGETIELLSPDRRVLQLPHAPLVHADGAEVPPALDAVDLSISIDGAPVAFTAGAPAPGQFAVDPDAAIALGYGDPDAAGVLRFGAPLPPAGTLTANYFVGEWEVEVLRFRGLLHVEVVAADANVVDTLSTAVGRALSRTRPPSPGRLHALTAVAWGPVGMPDPARGNGRSRTLAYRFDYELEEPLVRTGGGLISRIKVSLEPPHDERFEIVGTSPS